MRTILPLAIAFVLTAPATAAAQDPSLPPDNSAIGQYLEDVPEADGSKPSGEAGEDAAGEGGGAGASLPPGAAEDLQAEGPDGASAAVLAEATSPAGSTDDAGDQGGDDQAEPAGVENRTVIGNVLDQLGGGGSDGMGIALPLILVVSLAVALLLAVARRRQRRGQETIPP